MKSQQMQQKSLDVQNPYTKAIRLSWQKGCCHDPRNYHKIHNFQSKKKLMSKRTYGLGFEWWGHNKKPQRFYDILKLACQPYMDSPQFLI